jgi:hypothetical protein
LKEKKWAASNDFFRDTTSLRRMQGVDVQLFNLGISLTWMGSFTILPLYHRGKIL